MLIGGSGDPPNLPVIALYYARKGVVLQMTVTVYVCANDCSIGRRPTPTCGPPVAVGTCDIGTLYSLWLVAQCC